MGQKLAERKWDFFLMIDEKKRIELNEFLPDYLSRIGADVQMKEDGSGSRRNFSCIDPNHPHDKKPSMGLYREGNSLKAHCFTCSKSYDLIDVIGMIEGLGFKEAYSRACDLYEVEGRLERPKPQYRPKERVSCPDLTKEALKAHENLKSNTRTYFEQVRGLSREVVDRYKLGYFDLKELLEGKKHLATNIAQHYNLILPFWDENEKCVYLNAEISPPKRILDIYPKYANLAGVKTPIFNERYLNADYRLIAITEGVYDALSFESAGLPAMALMGVDHVRDFLKRVQTQPPKGRFLLALDNDERGQKQQRELKEGLEKAHIGFIEFSWNELEGVKDPNEALTRKGDQFREMIKGYKEQSEQSPALEDNRLHIETVQEMEERLEKEKALYLKNSASQCLYNYLERKIAEKHDPIPTGFEPLDKLLEGGLFTGLYVIGAISSLGKTTFTAQIGDNIAKSGIDVLFITLEMTKEELVDKSISRNTALYCEQKYGDCKNALTFSDLNVPSRIKNFSLGQSEVLEGALELYREYAHKVFYKGRTGINFTAKEVEKAVQDHIKYTGNKPVVIVDYLQIIDSLDPRLDERESIKKTVSHLRSIAGRYDIPVLVISSFNRESYTQDPSLKSFKNSGDIEYSADVALALAYNKPNPITEPTQYEKAILLKEPITISLTCLKQRNGRKGSTEINFYPQFNYFYQGAKGLLNR